jgi:hypothetical protein
VTGPLPTPRERLLYDAEAELSARPRDFESFVRLPLSVERFVDPVEDYSERGNRAAPAKLGGSSGRQLRALKGTREASPGR